MEKIKIADDEDFDFESYFSLCIVNELINKGFVKIKNEYLNNGICSNCGCKIGKNASFCIGTKCEELEEKGSKWVYPNFSIYCEQCSWGNENNK